MGRQGQRGLIVGTGPKALQVSEDVARLIELRQAGMSLRESAEICGITYGQAQDWIKKYIRHVSSKAVIAFRNQEIGKLEELWDKAYKIAETTHYHVFQGQETDAVDTDPNLKAIQTLVKISERKSRLMGGDRPIEKEVAAGEGDGDKPAPTVMTQAQFLQAMDALGKKLNISQRYGSSDVSDATSRTVDPLVDEASE